MNPFEQSVLATKQKTNAALLAALSRKTQKKEATAESTNLRLETLVTRILDRSARVGVIGLGYVGLPFAVEKAKAGFQTVGIDLSVERTDKINRGENYIPDVADDELRELVARGAVRATTDFRVIEELDVLVVAVPTPLTRNRVPDLTFVEGATREISRWLRPGQLVCLESTTYPGTTDEVMLPILQASGLVADQDFFLVHSPERIDPGNARFNTKNTTKVVGGVGHNSLQAGMTFYSQTIEAVVPVSSSKSAELVKVFENTFRSVNIALVNEITLLCDKMKINVWEVLDAAFTKPFGILPFYPGPGVGGHCIPIDPHYLEWKAKEYDFNTNIISLAGEINRRMPWFVVDKAGRILNQRGIALSKANVLVLGVAYKADIDDYRESPALQVLENFLAMGAQVTYHDPYVPEIVHAPFQMKGVELTAETLLNQDLVVIATNHRDFDYSWIVENCEAILDTRNATKSVETLRERIHLL